MTELTWEQVTAWRLSKHHLLERAARGHLIDVATDLGGLHAQVMSVAETIAWTRVRDVTPDDVRNALWQDRTLVKTWAMRGTLHLLPGREFPTYVAAFRSRQLYRRPSWLKYFNLTLEEMEALIEGVRVALDGRTLTREQLAAAVADVTGLPQVREHLLSGWGVFLKPAAFQGNLAFGPSAGQSVTFVRPDQWLGTWYDADPQEAMEELLRRFLTTYGPTTKEEVARWFGWEARDARSLFTSMKDELAEVDVEGWTGTTLATLIEQMQAQEDVPFNVRLLPNFDPYTIAYYRDSHYLDPDRKDLVFRSGAWISPAVIVNGRIKGLWEQEKKRSLLRIKVDMFEPAPPEVVEAVEAEAESLGEFLGLPVEVAWTQ